MSQDRGWDLEALLLQGGDARIARLPGGMNAYGCPPRPRPGQAAFASVTASTISPRAFAAAAALGERLRAGSDPEAEAATLRNALASACGVPAGGAVVLAPSGTDLHLLAAHWAAQNQDPGSDAAPLLVLAPEAAETGSGVPLALRGRHPGACAALGGAVTAGEGLAGVADVEARELPCRLDDGSPVPTAELDALAEATVDAAVAGGRRVLLVLADQSKSGLLAPSPACVLRLRQRHGERVDVLVDACQLRLAPATIGAYLARGWLVAVTGSKFATGPAFSGALLLPPASLPRLRAMPLAGALAAYSARADWPEGWAARESLSCSVNLGLLLRWEAALAEIRAFQALDPPALSGFLTEFSGAVSARLAADPALSPVAAAPPERGSAFGPGGWDGIATVFPFRMLDRRGGGLDAEATALVYRSLLARDIQLGQPLRCGTQGVALRLAASMRLAVEALDPAGPGAGAVIARALGVLDQAVALAGRL